MPTTWLEYLSIKRLLACSAAVVLSFVGATAGAHSIDYVATSISPPAMFLGGSGNFALVDDIPAGGEINFQLTFSINTQGSTTTYPKTITFGRTDITKPPGADDPAVLFGSAPGSTTTSCVFTGVASSCVVAVKITAPTTEGAYSVKIAATGGTGGSGGLAGGSGIVVNFTVEQSCVAVDTDLTLDVTPACIVIGTTSVAFEATLLAGATALSGKLIEFNVDGEFVSSENTDSAGTATLLYDPSQLSVGDHTVQASYQGEACTYEASGNSATLGVTYDFLGFQPPVQIEGSGVGLFSGKVIPVKIRIADAQGNPVTDEMPHVFFRKTSADVTEETAAESIASTAPDSGNTMRYDALSDQYVFNWDTSRVENGDYIIRVDLGEGQCGEAHTATVVVQKKGGKK